MSMESIRRASARAHRRAARERSNRSLKIVLWVIWLLCVLGTAGWNWYLDFAANRPVNLVGLLVYSGLAAIVALLAITLLEQWLHPHRFVE